MRMQHRMSSLLYAVRKAMAHDRVTKLKTATSLQAAAGSTWGLLAGKPYGRRHALV